MKDEYKCDDLWQVRERIRHIEEQVKKKPTDKDYRKVVKLLKQFGVNIDAESIPECRSVGELERWQRATIKKALQ